MIINLNEPQNCDELCKIIQRIINRHIKTTSSPALALSIKVVDTVESTAHIPKLEYKNEDNNSG